ncbi:MULTISPECIES: TlpA disulfide reductase family protein [Mycobacteroides]|uniref:Alkyl hydroperoxide reductase n=1 Tax=Mycobacteroides chelonae TaxID=1774 RepID=A0A1S1LSA2_MYCCH|nr:MULTISPECIES: TlpA disulfide reductase family protein [Mycobacteroides]KRQ18600.1 alkyl hydroperoxide reductase [Mycobacteroides sp. H003]KRQ21869.1 alkyl hydroperoxide reductase [Mycobacteroides sp. H092]KRQ46067.1 alkyl hydroperoxide reductase [Mycobacteroides sp. H101]KRQ49434.1 alkyl hydroperoxide reductase [Mycobacteroides sp. H063]KRQ52258.1 alkyl hydroperoxide reductase [Mycobacteroides sp. HXVII]
MRCVVVALAALVLLITGCSTGDDAVARGGQFQFVSPGGKTDIFYDPPEARQAPGSIEGQNLLDPTKTLSLKDFANKVVVINVWGQWCGPCRSEFSALEDVYRATHAQGVEFLGINVRDNEITKAQDFVTDRKVPYPSIYDPSMRTLIAFGRKFPTGAIPATLILDRQHRVAAVFLRELLPQDLQPAVERIAKEPAGATK